MDQTGHMIFRPVRQPVFRLQDPQVTQLRCFLFFRRDVLKGEIKNDYSGHFLKIRQFWHAAVQEAGGSDLLNRSYLRGGNQYEEA